MAFFKLVRVVEGRIIRKTPKADIGSRKHTKAKNQLNSYAPGSLIISGTNGQQNAGKNSQAADAAGNAKIQRKVFIVSLGPR